MTTENEERLKIQRRRNAVLGVMLCAFVVLLFLISIVKMM